jgi:glucosamine-6-phosphate deaminase
VKIVELDQACRKQQLGEGWFGSLEEVPTHALTMTVPAIMHCKTISCFVPDERKSEAVKNMLTGPVSTSCPASILREHPHTVLYLDKFAALQIR